VQSPVSIQNGEPVLGHDLNFMHGYRKVMKLYNSGNDAMAIVFIALPPTP
jgi:hypothetical protein